jgi:hypothetical protein
MKFSSDRDNNNRHYVIQRIAGFAITLNYHPAECIGFTVAYHFLGIYIVLSLVGGGDTHVSRVR